MESGHTDSYAEKAGLNGEEVRSHIAANLGRIGHNLLDHNLPGSLMCIGGDTLMALMNSARSTK